MGKARYVYFSDEVNEYLDGQNNVSGFIAGLVMEYKRQNELKEMSEEELALRLKKEKIIAEMELKLKEVENERYNKRD